MGSVTDIHNFDDQFRYQLEKLEEADIDDRDAEAVREFIRYQDTQRGLAAQNEREQLHLDLLLMSAAHAEEFFSDNEEMVKYLNEWRMEWSTALRVFLDQEPNAFDEAVKSIQVPLAGY